MTEEKKALLDAMHTIKETCESYHDVCHLCPLYSNEVGCYRQAFIPSDWNITNDTEQIWRAYK